MSTYLKITFVNKPEESGENTWALFWNEELAGCVLTREQIRAHFVWLMKWKEPAFLATIAGVEWNGERIVPDAFATRLAALEAKNERLNKPTQKDEYAREGWGYADLCSIGRYLPEDATALLDALYWFQLGSFEKPNVWRVDKHQIKAILLQEAEDTWLSLCPNFDSKKVEAVVDRLPDTINVKENQGWSVRYADVVEGSKVRKKPIGIIHKVTQAGRGIVDAQGKGTGKPVDVVRNVPKVTFDEIGGIDGILTQVREVVELPLKNPELFEHLGIKPHKGILLYGPPGCGKTMIAKAIANEVNAHFISVKGPELLNKYYGQSEENLRNLFEEAKTMQPSVIFFDEIDAIAQKRSGEDNLRFDARFVNQLLTLMDGIEDFGNVCVLAATNRKELLDQALLRPGRFDYMLHVELPDAAGCRKIFELTTRNMPLEPGLITEPLMEQLVGLSGAEIAFVARESAYNALRRKVNVEELLKNNAKGSVPLSDLNILQDDVKQAIKKLRQDSAIQLEKVIRENLFLPQEK